MPEYIEREAVLKIIGDNCPHDKGGYNTEEEMEVGATCYYIMKDVDNIPTADVVPRSEVEKLIEERDRYKKYYYRHEYDSWEAEIKQEVAREIFEEASKRFEVLLKDYPCEGDLVSAKKFLDFHWKPIVRSIMADYMPNSKRNT